MELRLYEKDFNTLSEEALLEIDGGVAFIPILIVGGKILGSGVLAGAGWYLGEKVANSIFK